MSDSLLSNNERKTFEVEDCLSAINDKGLFQIRTLAFLSCLWGFVPVISVLLPFFTIHPQYECRVKEHPNGMTFHPCNKEMICDEEFEVRVSPYNTYKTWIQDFNLTCENEYLIYLIGSIYFFGMIVSNLITPRYCDKYGRRPILFINVALYITNNVFVMLHSYNKLLLLYSFVSGFIYTGISIPAFVLNFEYTTKSSKNLFSSVITSAFSIGAVFQILIFYVSHQWKVSLSCGVVAYLIVLLNYSKVLESPSFLIANGNNEKLLECHKIAAEVNGKLDKYYEYVNSHPVKDFVPQKEDSVSRKGSLLNLLLDQDTSKTMLSVSVSWFCNATIAYGTLFNLKQYGTNIYVTGWTLYSACIVSILFASVVSKKFGCRVSLLLYYSINAGSNFCITALYFSNVDADIKAVLVRIFLFLSSFSISAIGSLNYMFTAEQFKDSKVSAISLGNMTNRLGGVISSPLVGNTFVQPTLVFTFLGLVSIIVLYRLPS